MDKLSKAQKDEFATAFAILALYDGGVSSCLTMNEERLSVEVSAEAMFAQRTTQGTE